MVSIPIFSASETFLRLFIINIVLSCTAIKILVKLFSLSHYTGTKNAWKKCFPAIFRKGKTIINGIEEETDIEFGSGDDQTKSTDTGVGIGAGVKVSKLIANVNYNMGLSNLSNDDEIEEKTKVVQVSLAVLFWYLINKIQQ